MRAKRSHDLNRLPGEPGAPTRPHRKPKFGEVNCSFVVEALAIAETHPAQTHAAASEASAQPRQSPANPWQRSIGVMDRWVRKHHEFMPVIDRSLPKRE